MVICCVSPTFSVHWLEWAQKSLIAFNDRFSHWKVPSTKKIIYVELIEAIKLLLEVTSTVIKYKVSLKCWAYQMQNINSIFELEHHVGIVPASLSVFSIFKQNIKWRLFCLQWILLSSTIHLNCSFLVCIVHSKVTRVYFSKNIH